MTMKFVTAASVCIMALGLGTASAMAASTFGHADENKDNKVSWNEALADNPSLTEVLFKAADSDHDGVLDEAEYGLLFGLGCAAK